jgi:hypothetical protein
MRVLLDTCVWGGAVADLVADGHDVEWVGSWERDPGDEQGRVAAMVLRHHAGELQKGTLITAELGRVRVRSAQ